jgi:hypothetical protein
MVMAIRIEKPYYPIVYVRGYAMTAGERERTFNDTYYGFSATSVEKRDTPPPEYFEMDLFEGQLIRLMKMRDYAYLDEVNRGLENSSANPSRSLWVCRFYDRDHVLGKLRGIEEHAGDLHTLVCETIPGRLRDCGVDLGDNDEDYKVILVAHSMGGLVCRTLIQNQFPARGQDPKRWIHRLVTMGSPHRGIELGRVPDIVEALSAQLNPFDSGIFHEPRMREYLKLEERTGPEHDAPFRYDVHSLGPQDGPHFFPVKRCLCLIGSDYHSYGPVRAATGSFSDGLVKQDRAYIVAGPAPAAGAKYPDSQTCYWANVHRAHSGDRGIVNSYESYENLHRFLFGDTRFEVALEEFRITTDDDPAIRYFYDFECRISIRGTASYLHRREQDPCENAMRFGRAEVPSHLPLHTAFMNSALRDEGSTFSHFALRLNVIEHRVKHGALWDHEYPGRSIYTETLEVRVGDCSSSEPEEAVGYRWLSGSEAWQPAVRTGSGAFRFPLRPAETLEGVVEVVAGVWPDPALTCDGCDGEGAGAVD